MLLTNKQYLGEIGLYYPSNCMDTAHHNVPWEILYDSRWGCSRGTLISLKDEIEKTHHNKILISSEDICNFSLKHINSLRNFFQRHKTRIIIYLRNQFDYILSSWSENVKNTESDITFREHYEFCMKNCLPKLNYKILLENWATVFGKENLILKIYNKNLGKGLYEGFLDIFNLKVDHKKIKINERLNVGLSPQELNVLRIVNKYNLKLGFAKRKKFNLELIDAINQNFKIDENLDFLKNSSKLQRQTEIFFETSNTHVARAYFEMKNLF